MDFWGQTTNVFDCAIELDPSARLGTFAALRPALLIEVFATESSKAEIRESEYQVAGYQENRVLGKGGRGKFWR
jgi:hypothetical protein